MNPPIRHRRHVIPSATLPIEEMTRNVPEGNRPTLPSTPVRSTHTIASYQDRYLASSSEFCISPHWQRLTQNLFPRIGMNVPWQNLPEDNWVPGAMCLLHHLSDIDVDFRHTPSNEGQEGCRHSEFRQEGTSENGRATVCWAPHTMAHVHVGVREDLNIHFPIINQFYVHYENHPLDISGRTPLPLGPNVLNLRGFFGLRSGVSIPDRNLYDSMFPPVTPFGSSISLCDSIENCVWGLHYSFNGFVEPFARENGESVIDGFWNSLGWGRAFYQMTHLPPDTIDMTLNGFLEHIGRPLLSDATSHYLQTHRETWTPNPRLLSLLEAGVIEIAASLQPVRAIFPENIEVTLHSLEEVRRVLNQESSEVQNSETRQFFQNFQTLFNQQTHINRLNFFSIFNGFDSNGNPLQRAGQNVQESPHLDLAVALPAFSYSQALEGGGRIQIQNLIAERITVRGPSLQEMNANLWETQEPIQIVLQNPYIGGLCVDREPLHIILPRMHADEIVVTLPSFSEIRQILNIDPDSHFEFSQIAEHLEELIGYCRLRASHLRMDNKFEISYTNFDIRITGAGARIDTLLLYSTNPDTSDVAYANHRIPHLIFRNANFPNVSIQSGYLGRINARAQSNVIDEMELIFPPSRIQMRSPRIHLEGTLTYDAQPQDSEDANNANPCRANPLITRLNLGDIQNSHINSADIRDLNINFDSRNPDLNQIYMSLLLHSHIEAGSVVSPNPNLQQVELSGGNIGSPDAHEQRGAFLESEISYPKNGRPGHFAHHTLLAGEMGLRFAINPRFPPGQLPISFSAIMSNLTARSDDACLYFSSNDEFYVDGRAALRGPQGEDLCRLDRIRNHLPRLDHRWNENLDHAAILLEGDFNQLNLGISNFITLGEMSHQLSGSLHVGLERFWRNDSNEWEIDLVNAQLNNLAGLVRANVVGRSNTFTLVNDSNSSHFTLGRFLFQGHSVPRSPESDNERCEAADTSRATIFYHYPWDRFILQNFAIYLIGSHPSQPYIRFYSPYGYVERRGNAPDRPGILFDLPHTYLDSHFTGLPRMRFGNPP